MMPREDQPEMVAHMPILEEVAARASVILELGVGHGNGSTRAFTRGLERSPKNDRLHISVDSDPSRPDEEPDVAWWHVVHGRTEDLSTVEAVEDILGPRAPDIIFIDTEHTKAQLARELEIWSPLASRNTVWLFHDVWMWDQYNPMVEAIWEFMAYREGWIYTELTKVSHGLGRMEWLEDEEIERREL